MIITIISFIIIYLCFGDFDYHYFDFEALGNRIYTK